MSLMTTEALHYIYKYTHSDYMFYFVNSRHI